MTLEFFMSMIPPTTTYQTIKVDTRGKAPRFYKDEKLRTVESKLLGNLFSYAPEKPLDGALRLIVRWCFPKSNKHSDGEYKATRPDTDNLQKLLKDCMTKSGFWTDDARVASELVEKFWATRPGIYIKVEEIYAKTND